MVRLLERVHPLGIDRLLLVKFLPGIRMVGWKLSYLRWPNRVYARALADAIQRAHKTSMPFIQRSFYLLNARSIFAIFLRVKNAVGLCVRVFCVRCLFSHYKIVFKDWSYSC